MDYTIKGRRVKCIKMNDLYPVKPGTLGTILFADDIGNIHVKWDDGSRLALVPGEDEYVFLEETSSQRN